MQYIVLELLLFGVVPTDLSIIGMFITCFGVALVVAAPAARPGVDPYPERCLPPLK